MSCNNCGEDLMNMGRHIMMMYTNDIMTAAELNWLPGHIQMLRRLMASVLMEKDYAETTEEDIKFFMASFESYRQKEKEVEG